jgi:hypothetical protein
MPTPEEIVDPIITALEYIAKATVESDKSLLELVKALTDRVLMLEDKVNLLLMTTRGKQ